MDPLIKIKRLVLARRVLFTEKAEAEIAADQLSKNLIYEAIWNAPAINKTIRSKNPKSGKRETLYIIKGLTFDGLAIYTKGKILSYQNQEIFYVLISSKKAFD
jgi:hypothetical protein